MKFQILTEVEYKEFWDNYEYKNFLSSIEISKLKEKNNCKTYYVGVKENKKIIAAAMLLATKKSLDKYEFYSPRGLLLDYSNTELLIFFTEHLKEYIKDLKGYILRINPYIPKEENINTINTLKDLGYIEVEKQYRKQLNTINVLDINNKKINDILDESVFKNDLIKTEKIGINLKEIDINEIENFYEILKNSSKRKIKSLNYYKELYNLYHDKNEIKFFITELDLNKYLKQLKKAKNKKNKDSIDKIINKVNIIKENTDSDIIILSSAIYLLIKPEILLLEFGNNDEYSIFNSKYFINLQLIKYGIENKYKTFNFYKEKDFSKVFNSKNIELIGEYELPVSRIYKIIKLLGKR